MSKKIMGQKVDHGAPFLVVGFGKVQVSFSESRRGIVLKRNGPNIFTTKCIFPTCLKTKISPTSINYSETKLSQPFVKIAHVLA